MNEKEARETLKPFKEVCETFPPTKGRDIYTAKGYLQAIEKAKGLEDAVRYMTAHSEPPFAGNFKWSREIREVGKESLAQWEKEK